MLPGAFDDFPLTAMTRRPSIVVSGSLVSGGDSLSSPIADVNVTPAAIVEYALSERETRIHRPAYAAAAPVVRRRAPPEPSHCVH